MTRLLEHLRDRLVPAVLMATGLTLVAAGILSYGTPVAADGLPAGSGGASASVDADGLLVIPTLRPEPDGGGDASAGSGERATATRIAIAALGIDLPVIRPPGGATTYPPCDVAMYIQQLGQPGEGRGTYLYAHARPGMFLPLLEASRVDRGSGMLGDLVQVWTSDDRLFLYVISEVRPHQLTLDDAIAATTEQLWLQTSEGPRGTKPKLQVVATYLSSGPADHASAHPVARPVICG